MRTLPQLLLRPGGLTAAALLLVALTPVTAEAATVPGPGVGWIRVGHLSPKVPPVDIYFAPFGQAEKVVIRKAGYGAVTPYSSLDPGKYTLSMRPADAASSTPPALSATIDVAERTAYSLLVFANGPDSTLKGDPRHRRPHRAGRRQGPAPDRRGVGGDRPGQRRGPDRRPDRQGRRLRLQTSPYVDVPEGRWPLQLTGGTVQSTANVDVRAGTSTTLLVTENSGALKVNPISDGASLPEPPKLGVETGGGGTAPSSGRPWWPAFAAAGLLAALLVGRRAARAR